MSGVLLLEPTDPLFAELGRRFIEVGLGVEGATRYYSVQTNANPYLIRLSQTPRQLQREAYGPEVTHIYSADTYNEMVRGPRPRTGE